MVEQFVRDPDESAILPILPDMRMIQECFRILKSHLSLPQRSKAMRLYGTSSSGLSVSGTNEESNLMQTIARRDAEISKFLTLFATALK